MTVKIRLLGPEDGAVLDHVASDVFDHPVASGWAAEFLGDPRHHLAVALDEGVVVGFASGVHYINPDKPPELWINEVGVAPTHQRQGVASRLLAVLMDRGAGLGCVQAWVLTSPANTAARRLYARAGGREADELSVMVEFPLAPGRR
ncbi:MAG TPA: GNAT family N-acetyltransferase [Gemmatimonadales bacterium]|nr:GNAT family N-acetyltransferase [Gemmatimonadales bacterium]